MKRFLLWMVVTIGLVAVDRASAAVVVIGNGSNESVDIRLVTDAGETIETQLAAAETRAFACNQSAKIRISSHEPAIELQLEAYTAYLFTNRNGKQELTGIQLEGRAPPAGPLPSAAVTSKPITIPVRLMVDDSERRTRAAWEPVLKKRFTQSSEILAAHVGVRFELAEMAIWDADPKATDLAALLADFTKVVSLKPGEIAVGYTSRRFEPIPGDAAKVVPFAAPVQAFQSHILIREREPKTEAERVEVLVQQLGRLLGAVAVPDRLSVMRPRLGDGQAIQTKFRIGFDPLNVLAMNIVADEIRTGKVHKLTDLSSGAQTRLGRIYGTVRQVLPDAPLPELYLALLERAAIRPADGVVPAAGIAPVVKAPEVGRSRNAKEEAVRQVVLAVVAKAEENSKFPVAIRIKGDALTTEFIRAAAVAALAQEPEYRESAFLLALGLALDDSNVLRENPITATFCKVVESDQERRQRLAVLGNPTIRSRRDLCQHFAISATLTDMAGAELAETAGLLKEQSDMSKTSGFSFSDLCADFAGIEFAKLIKAKPETMKTIAEKFTVADYVPSVDGLRDGISAVKFKAEFGSTTNVLFKDAYDAVWKRVHALPIYQTK